MLNKEYEIIIKKQPAKFLLYIENKISIAIEEKIDILSRGNFDNLDIKELNPKGHNYYRLRVGKYRIIFKIEESKLIIMILKIGSRGDIYK